MMLVLKEVILEF